MQYFAGTVPLVKEASVLYRAGGKRARPLKAMDGFALVLLINEGDELYLMMGSTNTVVALGAMRRGAKVFQLSYARASAYLAQNGPTQKTTSDEEMKEITGDGGQDSKTKISSFDVHRIAMFAPEFFYPLQSKDAEALEISRAWGRLSAAMEDRKARINRMRVAYYQDAVMGGQDIGVTIDEVRAAFDELVDKKKTTDMQLRFLFDEEDKASKELDSVMSHSGLYKVVFKPIEGVGPRIAARFISAIERIVRFDTPDDLSRYAGMAPTRDGKLPSRKRGGLVSRKPSLNTACYMLQDQMGGYSANTPFGQALKEQVARECPCTQEERNADKTLKSKHGIAVRRARIAMTRLFLKQIWEDWRKYAGLPKSA